MTTSRISTLVDPRGHAVDERHDPEQPGPAQADEPAEPENDARSHWFAIRGDCASTRPMRINAAGGIGLAVAIHQGMPRATAPEQYRERHHVEAQAVGALRRISEDLAIGPLC